MVVADTNRSGTTMTSLLSIMCVLHHVGALSQQPTTTHCSTCKIQNLQHCHTCLTLSILPCNHLLVGIRFVACFTQVGGAAQ